MVVPGGNWVIKFGDLPEAFVPTGSLIMAHTIVELMMHPFRSDECCHHVRPMFGGSQLFTIIETNHNLQDIQGVQIKVTSYVP